MLSPTRLLAAALAAAAVAAAPSGQAPPDGIDFDLVVTAAEPASAAVGADVVAVNVWTHFSLLDPNTCSSASPDNRCEKALLFFEDGGEATVTVAAGQPVGDYDVVVYASGESGTAYDEVGRSIAHVNPAGLGAFPLPGDELVSFEAEAGKHYLAVVFHRAGIGGYELTASVA